MQRGGLAPAGQPSWWLILYHKFQQTGLLQGLPRWGKKPDNIYVATDRLRRWRRKPLRRLKAGTHLRPHTIEQGIVCLKSVNLKLYKS